MNYWTARFISSQLRIWQHLDVFRLSWCPFATLGLPNESFVPFIGFDKSIVSNASDIWLVLIVIEKPGTTAVDGGQ